jgi:hypothetical protein
LPNQQSHRQSHDSKEIFHTASFLFEQRFETTSESSQSLIVGRQRGAPD